MNKVQKIAISTVIAAAAALPLLAAAQITTVTSSGTLVSVTALIAWLSAILRILFTIFGILAVLLILWSAVLFVTAGGNEDRRKSATGFLKWGIVGIVVAVLAFTIIPLVQSIIGLQ